MSTTATVEVLTAEVRVLMVGSRQVTLSVARQLDTVDPRAIEAFGRIRTGSVDDEVVEVIGSANGVLATSFASKQGHFCDVASEYGTKCPQARTLLAAAKAAASLDAAEWDAVSAHHRHHWAAYRPDEPTYTEWSALPLIVLAGLK